MKRFLAIILLGLSSLVTAQTIQTTPNLITSGTTHTWYGVQTGSIPDTYMPGGPQPKYDPATNTIAFSYGSASIGQTYAVNQALASVGAGVKVNGYNYSYEVRNMNGDDRQNGIDTFTVSQLLRGQNNSVLLSSSQYYNSKFDWKTITGTKVAANPYNIADTTYIQFGVQGADGGFWAGYFGPQIRNVSMSLNYSIDPCFNNPAYSPTCANYNTVSISDNLLSGTTGVQAYAINSALALAGAGATIHGFNYGYNYNVAGRDCAVWNLFGICISGWNYSDAGVNTSITRSDGTTLYSESNTHNGGDNGTSGTYSKQYRLSSSVPMSTLGTFTMSPWTSGNASITNMYSQAVYTADPCVTNPLSSTTCSGYAAAYLTQQCSINALYDSNCPGYAQALFTQQCNANQLSNTACPGYAAAYLTQQCNLNALYSTTCSGYSAALNQCSTNPLSNTMCPSYQTATTECSVNPLYGSYCSGYTVAVNECSVNPLSHSYCPSYQTATTECSANSLYGSYCPGYTSAQATCSTNPLSNTLCSNYATASASCSANQLNATYCPSYQTTLSACTADPLSNNLCPNYSAASASCAVNQLNATYCPSYQSTMNTCSVNPLSNSLCPGYAVATSSCNTNPLYASYCSGYQTALNTCSANPLSNTMCPTYQETSSTCSANPLYANYCPGYQFAYSCSLDGLYSKQCPNYSEAYAKKNILNIGSTSTTTATTVDTSTIVLAQSSDPVAQAAPVVSDPVVNSVVTTKSTATNAEASPAAVVKLTAPAATTTTVTNTQEAAKDNKKTDSTTTTAVAKDGVRPDRPTTTREQIAEQRREAARKEAVAKGKDLANEMGKMADMQAQMEVQNVVIQAMGFTPGFDNYNRFILPDGQGYKPFTIYNNQRTVDSPSGRGLFGGSDVVHQRMVDSQYNLGN